MVWHYPGLKVLNLVYKATVHKPSKINSPEPSNQFNAECKMNDCLSLFYFAIKRIIHRKLESGVYC